MRSIKEIAEKVKEKEFDIFNTFINLVVYLPFSEAKPHLNADVTEESWEEVRKPLTEEVVKREMQYYMAFALEKAANHRGISANRSIDHFKRWLWLLCDGDLLAVAEDDDKYAMYGVPILKAICDKYGFTFPEDEKMQRMAQGKPCHDGCSEGCS